MNIPEGLLPYGEKTLILVADKLRAKVYLAHGREFDLVEEIKNDRLTLDDFERNEVGNVGGGVIIEEDEDFKEREAHLFYQKLADILFDKKQRNEFEKLIIAIPHNEKNAIVDDLHEYVKKCLDLVIPKELTGLENSEIMEKINESREEI